MVNEWVEKPIKELAEIQSGGTPSTLKTEYWNGDIMWCTPSDITNNEGIFLDKTERTITQHGIDNSSAVMLPAGTILLCTRATIGEIAIARKSMCTNQGFKNLIVNEAINNIFLYYALQMVKQEMISKSYGSTFLELSKKSLEAIKLLIPSLVEEQINIANSLLDIDSLIECLIKEIKKKKNIKYGILQNLITGEERLDGYTGEWVSINMAKKSKIKARIGWQGLTTAEYLNVGYSYLVTGTDFEDGRVNWEECHYVTADRYFQDPNIQLMNGDILITKDGTIGKVALVDGLEKPATLNSGVFVVRPINKAYSANFLYYVLESRVFRDFLGMLSAGSTIAHLYQKDLVNFSFMAPPTIEEQENIASIIYDLDCDVRHLETKLRKYIKIKQGMMDELLTGKIRLM